MRFGLTATLRQPRGAWLYMALAAAALGMFGAGRAAAFNEPTGYGTLKFKTGVLLLKQAFPDAKLITAAAGTSANGVKIPDPPFTMDRFELTNQTVGPLKNCNVVLQCYQDVFYQATVTCPDDKAAMAKYLHGEYGQPTSRPRENLEEWYGEKTHISFNPGGGTFLIEDLNTSRAASQALSGHIMKELMRMQGGGAPQ